MDNRLLPHPDNLILTLENLLKANGYNEIAEKMQGCSCEYYRDYENLSLGKGFNLKLSMGLHFEIRGENLSFFENKKNRDIVLKYANKIPKKECRYGFGSIEFSPKIVKVPTKREFDSDIKFTIETFTGNEEHSIPDVIINNSKEMSEVYQYIYIIENVLRLFIENKLISFFDIDYLDNITIPKRITDKIKQRIESDEKNRWMDFERNSLLNFFDLMDLSTVIDSNWKLFENDFRNREWIKSKILEINECRKLIAHNNNSIDSHSKEVLILNSKSILKQLNYLE